ncbi:MAG TPA: L-threonylcarbamoyladenylate synthase [Puia sp.]|nr:L-threonylcarbamoyladenylate synthase [Puia sp.]
MWYFESFGIFTENQPLEFEEDIIQCLETLHRGGIILYPTDTIWGIGCDATNPDAVEKIFDLKRRTPAKSMIVLLADPRDINRYTSRPQPYIAEYLEKATKPTTVIYEAALGLAENLVSEDGSIAMRIVKEDFCRHLIKRFRKPLVSTSANVSGEASPENFAGIADEIKQGVDYIVKYRQQDDRTFGASSIVRFNKSGEPVILRS